MSYVVFKNKGEIDIRFVTTFGASVKATTNPIGMFGTGLKYAIATLMREGCGVTISSGELLLGFCTREETLRDQTFEFIDMIKSDGSEPIEMPFTTMYGLKWKLWQAFRELYSNVLDENGTCYISEEFPVCEEGHTIIAVEGQEFVELFMTKGDIFIEGTPIVENSIADVYEGKSDKVFWRGIRVADYKKPYLFKYNFKSYLDLTEDRTIRYQFMVDALLVQLVIHSNDKQFLYKVLTATDNYAEHSLNFNDVEADPSVAFSETIAQLRWEKHKGVNSSASGYYDRTVKLREKVTTYKPTCTEEQMYQQARNFLRDIECPINKFPILFVQTLGDKVYGMHEEGKIYISRIAFHLDFPQFVKQLYRAHVDQEFWQQGKNKEKDAEIAYSLTDYVIGKLLFLGAKTKDMEGFETILSQSPESEYDDEEEDEEPVNPRLVLVPKYDEDEIPY